MGRANVYLVLSDTEGVMQWKIGVTTNLEQRLNSLKTANPNIVGVSKLYEADEERCYQIESFLKRTLKSHKINGEWIRYDGIDPDKFTALCEKVDGNMTLIANMINEDKKIKDKL